MINRKKTYDNIRKNFGRLSSSQVQGFEATFNEWEKWVSENRIDNDVRKLSYILATDWHEGGGTMQPIKEKGGNAYFIKLYWTNQKKAKELGNLSAQDAVNYCGKGKPQLTGRNNYRKMGKILGLPLEQNPDLMFNMEVATKVMFEGMLKGKSFKGDFTGKSLEDYFNKTTNDPVNARRIINGTDKAKLIAGYYEEFLDSIVLN